MVEEHLNFKNILVIHFGQLGDVIIGLPALRAIREHFSRAKITLMVGKSAAAIARNASVADDLIIVDRVQMRDGNKVRSVLDILRLVRDVRGRRFDFAIDLHSLSETNLLAMLAGIPVRLYADRKGRSINRFSNYPTTPPREDRGLHAALRYLDVIRPLGIDAEAKLKLRVMPDDIDHVRSKFVAAGLLDRPLVGIFLGAGHPDRRWPSETAAKLADLLREKGVDTAVFLGPEERELLPSIRSMFPAGTGLFDDLDLLRLLAAVTLLDVLVTNDSGPAHLAAATDTPIVLISHPSAPNEFLPLTERLTVVRDAPIELIEADTVLGHVMYWLENDNASVTC